MKKKEEIWDWGWAGLCLCECVYLLVFVCVGHEGETGIYIVALKLLFYFWDFFFHPLGLLLLL